MTKITRIAKKLLDKGYVEEARELLAADESALPDGFASPDDEFGKAWTEFLSSIKQNLITLDTKTHHIYDTERLYEMLEQTVLEFR